MKSRKIPITIAIDSAVLPLIDEYVYENKTTRSTFINDLIAQRLDIKEVSTNDQEKENKNNG